MNEIKISDIKGIRVGHAQNVKGATGCTVILCEKGACAGVDVRGGAPATRETEILNPVHMIEKIHGVLLSGGSAYGLDAAAGVMAYLEEKGVGFDVGMGVVPLVCGASLFDLTLGDFKCRPDKAMGYKACQNSESEEPKEGNVGAGTGASLGKLCGSERMMKSGIGIYAIQVGEVQCAALVAVNALGDVINLDTGKQMAGLLSENKREMISTEKTMVAEIEGNRNIFKGNTTIGCIITNAKLNKSQASKLASIAHNGLARVIRPVHTSVDGDTVFVMATGEVEAAADSLGVLSTWVMAKAINRAARKAETAYGLKCARDFDLL